MNLLALVLGQFVALPAPVTVPPGAPLLIRADVGRGSMAELNGKVVIAFTSDERSVATRKAVNTGDLWIATWDGVAVTSRLVCQGTGQGFTGAALAATASRVLVIATSAAGLHAVPLDAALQPLGPPCGTLLTSEPSVDVSVTAVADSFLVLTQASATQLIVVRWVTAMGAFVVPAYVSSAVMPAGPTGLAFDGGALVAYRQTASGDLSNFQTSPMMSTSPVPAPASASYGTFTTTLMESGPQLVGWSRTSSGWALVVSSVATGLPSATPRTWLAAPASLPPPRPIVVASDGGVAVFSWLSGTNAPAQLDVVKIPTVTSLSLPTGSTPIGATTQAVVTQDAPGSFALRELNIGARLVGPPQGFVNARPSHQQSVNVVWTDSGWLVVWEEPGTQLPAITPRSTVRAILTNGASFIQLAVQPVPGRRPRIRRPPTGPLLASFELPDGGSTILPLTVTSSMLLVGAAPVVADIGALGGFEVNAMELFRWQPAGGLGTRVYRGASLLPMVDPASSRGAFAADTFWLPSVRVADATGFQLDGGLIPVPLSAASVEGEIAVGAAPESAPTELLYAWNEADGVGLTSALQTSPPAFGSSFSMASARFLGGRPVRVADRWLVGVRPATGGVIVQSWHPMLGTRPLRLGNERGEIVEFVAAEAPDGGAAAFVWTTWENDGLDAGLRLSVQVVTVSGDGGVADGGVGPDGGVSNADAGSRPDAGPTGDGGAGGDAGESRDAGVNADAGVAVVDGGADGDGGVRGTVVFIPQSCGCGSSGNGLLWPLLFFALRAAERAIRRVSLREKKTSCLKPMKMV